MGYYRHTAMVVMLNDYDKDAAKRVYEKAVELFHIHTNTADCYAPVSPLTRLPVNGYWSFCIFPSGSKFGWDHQENEAKAREQFKAWLTETYDTLAFPHWVEVIVRDEQADPKVVEHNAMKIIDDKEIYYRKKAEP